MREETYMYIHSNKQTSNTEGHNISNSFNKLLQHQQSGLCKYD